MITQQKVRRDSDKNGFNFFLIYDIYPPRRFMFINWGYSRDLETFLTF